jgi:hypothetical protein
MNDNTDRNLFASILDASVDHVELPKALPEGAYRGIVGLATYDKSKNKGTMFVRWPISSIEAVEAPKSMTEDEFAEAIEAAGGLEGKSIDHTIYITERNAFRIDQFHSHCGLNLKETHRAGASRRQLNDQVTNAEVGFIIEHQFPEGADPDDPETPRFARIARTYNLSDE